MALGKDDPIFERVEQQDNVRYVPVVMQSARKRRLSQLVTSSPESGPASPLQPSYDTIFEISHVLVNQMSSFSAFYVFNNIIDNGQGPGAFQWSR